MTRLTDALGNSTFFTYNADSRLTSYTDARGNTTTYQYDFSDNVTKVTYPTARLTRTVMTRTGNVTSWTNARGQTLQYAYNSLGLVTSKTYADSSTVTFNFDPSGFRLLNATDSSGTYAFTYNVAGPDRDLRRPIWPHAGVRIQHRRPTAVQHRRTRLHRELLVRHLGRLGKLTDGSNASIVQYTYDLAGRLVREDNGNGTFTTYAYDPAGNAINATTTRMLPRSIRATTILRQHEPDHLMTTGGVETDYGYDAVSQLTSVNMPGRSIQYVYDDVGNRVSVTDNGVPTSYIVNSRNEYTAVGTDTYAYDPDGNRISQTVGGVTTNFTFNQENELIGTATPSAGNSWAYQLDPFGQRVAMTANGVTTRSMIDPTGIGNLVATYDGTTGNLTDHYVYGLGLVEPGRSE